MVNSGDNQNINQGDISQQNVYAVSKRGAKLKKVSVSLPFGIGSAEWEPDMEEKVTLDSELIKLLEWLSKQQGTSVDIALKKAVTMAAYIYDITVNQGGKLLVQRKDKTIGEIILK